jgi:hypothetical protein
MIEPEDQTMILNAIRLLREEILCLKGCSVCDHMATRIADDLEEYVRKDPGPKAASEVTNDTALKMLSEVIEASRDAEAKALEQVKAEFIRLRGLVAIGAGLAVLTKKAWYSEESPKPEVIDALKAAQKFSEVKV